LQFLTVPDRSTGAYHYYIVDQIEEQLFQHLKELWERQIPVVSGSAVIRKGCPIISIDYGIPYLTSAIPLDEVFESGDRLGDKLTVGDIIVVVLTDHAQDKVVTYSKKKVRLEVPIEDILVFSLRYTEEMSEIYSFFRIVQPPDPSLTEAKKKV
jgi:hypothetical protein